MGFDRLLNPSEQTSHSSERAIVDNIAPSRLRLHIRQQPIATRACSAGEKDRRTIDPPPILQLLLTDFRPDSKTDMAILQNSRLAVACLTIPTGSTRELLITSTSNPIHQINVLCRYYQEGHMYLLSTRRTIPIRKLPHIKLSMNTT